MISIMVCGGGAGIVAGECFLSFFFFFLVNLESSCTVNVNDEVFNVCRA